MPPNYHLELELSKKGYKLIAGVDEVGRGPLAGPVVAAAVILPLKKTIKGLDDSKKLSEKKREALYKIILNRAVSIGIGIIDNKEIDRINILQASLLAMYQAIRGLDFLPDHILIDGINTIKTIKNIKQTAIIKGDGKIASIAAASIVAKVARDRLMLELHEKFPRYNFKKHKGYGTAEHFSALKKYGPCIIHRHSWDAVSSNNNF